MFHVKHPTDGQESTNHESLAAIAAKDLHDLDIEVPSEAVAQCCLYLTKLLEANQSVNLTAIRSVQDALRLHVVDSLAPLSHINAAPHGPLCDVGSGGGFPGVPLCIASGRQGVLLDSALRKVTVVANLLDALDLTAITAIHARAEEYAAGHPGQFSVVTIRAVAELPVLVEYASPLLAKGGLFVALKGSPSPEEVERGQRAGEMCGLRLRSTSTYALPRGGEDRCLLVFELSGEPSTRLPRPVGRALKRPLA